MIGTAEGPAVHVEPVMGTVASFQVWPDPPAAAAWRPAVAEACDILHDADRLFSTWDPGSVASRYRRGELDPADVPDDLAVVIRLCRLVTTASDGWFDPWALPGGFDSTGLVKGWAVERAISVLRRAGIRGAMLNVGGDIAVIGRPGADEVWTVALRHPDHADAAACVIEVESAVATSGAYERGAHLIDPRTGSPACRVASATVTGPSLAVADGLATALAVAGEAGLAFVAEAEGYEGLVIRADGTAAGTRGFPVRADLS